MKHNATCLEYVFMFFEAELFRNDDTYIIPPTSSSLNQHCAFVQTVQRFYLRPVKTKAF